jgi:hypothetical protein
VQRTSHAVEFQFVKYDDERTRDVVSLTPAQTGDAVYCKNPVISTSLIIDTRLLVCLFGAGMTRFAHQRRLHVIDSARGLLFEVPPACPCHVTCCSSDMCDNSTPVAQQAFERIKFCFLLIFVTDFQQQFLL